MVREATTEDIARIVELGSQSLIDGPYKGEIDNPERSAKLALQVIENAKGKVLLWENDDARIVGLLGFVIFPHYFTGELTANEIMWYVLPEERKGGAGIKLLWAAEELAKKLGATRMQFTAPTEEVGALYAKFGYFKVEVGYRKDLTVRNAIH